MTNAHLATEAVCAWRNEAIRRPADGQQTTNADVTWLTHMFRLGPSP